MKMGTGMKPAMRMGAGMGMRMRGGDGNGDERGIGAALLVTQSLRRAIGSLRGITIRR